MVRNPRPEPESRTIVANGLDLHYLDWGGGGSPLVVLVHGGRDHCRTWDDVVAALPPDWRIIAPDLRGHGDSEWARGGCYSLWDYVADLDSMIRMIAGPASPVVLVGHSLGGAICLQLAGARPNQVCGVVAIEPFGMGPGAGPEVLDAAISHDVVKITPVATVAPAHDRLRFYLDSIDRFEQRNPVGYASIEDGIARALAANPRLTPAIAQRVVSYGMTARHDGTYTWKFDNRVRIASPYSFSFEEATEIWGQITGPVLVVNGGHTQRTATISDAFAANFRDFQSVLVPGAAHMVQQEQPLAVAAQIVSLVETVVPEPQERSVSTARRPGM